MPISQAANRQPLVVDESFNTFRQPVGPLLVLDYVSRLNFRKDYLDSFRKYEIDLKVPYYLLFYPHKSELFVFRLADEAYAPIEPNSMGRLAIPELELEVAVLDGWVRYWFRGNLIPLPGEMLKRLEASQNQAISLQDQLDAARAELAQMKSDRNANGHS